MFILASASPRRKELLHKLLPEFSIIVPNIDERILHLDPKDLASEESKHKAYAIYSKYPRDEVLSCDTIVVLDGEVLGKPKDEEEAKAMLRLESGKKQIVLSGYTYIGEGREITRTVATEVYFNELSEELIEGSYDNVMGLPTEDIAAHVFRTR